MNESPAVIESKPLVTQPEEKQLTKREAQSKVNASEKGLSFQNMEEMFRFCVACVNSHQFKDLDSPEVALIRMQAGMEIGLSPIWSLTNIMVTNGRPSVWGDGLLGIVLAHKDCEDVIETEEGNFPADTYAAVCEVRRKGRVPVIRKFSVADAKRAQIFGKNVHDKYPKRMLQMRARGFACRDAFADALRGLGMREELEGITEPKPTTGRVVSREMVLEDTHAAIDERVSEEAATEHLAHVAEEAKGATKSEDQEFGWEVDK